MILLPTFQSTLKSEMHYLMRRRRHISTLLGRSEMVPIFERNVPVTQK